MKLKSFYMIICCFLLVVAKAFAAVPESVEPAFWWTGMKNTELQVLIYADKVADSKVSITAKSARLKETVRMENSNYLILYLDLSKAVPEQFNIVLEQGGKKENHPV